MAAQITPGRLLTAPGFTVPDWSALSKQWDRQVAAEKRSSRDDLVVSYPASKITIGHYDDDALDNPARQQLTGDTQGEGRLTCARCRHCKEVLGVSRQVFVEGLLLPFTKPAHLRRRDL